MADEGFGELAGQRVVLRRFRPGDLTPFVAYRSSPEVARFQGWDAPYPLAEGERFVRQRREGHLHESTWAKGEWTDDLLYALLDHEWRSSRT
jgi:RimJ/RimL family protein N-acetyltransferase